MIKWFWEVGVAWLEAQLCRAHRQRFQQGEHSSACPLLGRPRSATQTSWLQPSPGSWVLPKPKGFNPRWVGQVPAVVALERSPCHLWEPLGHLSRGTLLMTNMRFPHGFVPQLSESAAYQAPAQIQGSYRSPHLAAWALWWEDGAVIWLCWVAALMAAATRGQ